MGLKQSHPKVDKKIICTSHYKAKGTCKCKQGQRRPKWKALRGFTFNTQAQAIGREEHAKRETRKQKNH
jgi:hypothetical protein